MSKIFISYRRDDSGYQVDRLYDLLIQKHGIPKDDVFVDVDNIPFGVDFADHLNVKVAQCDIVFAVIGDSWINSRDPKTGQRRLEDRNDFVRIELEAALERGIPIVPILLDDTQLPTEEELPDPLRPLVLRNGALLRRLSFDNDVARLIRGLGDNFRSLIAEKRENGGSVTEKRPTIYEARKLFQNHVYGTLIWRIRVVSLAVGLASCLTGYIVEEELPNSIYAIDYVLLSNIALSILLGLLAYLKWAISRRLSIQCLTFFLWAPLTAILDCLLLGTIMELLDEVPDWSESDAIRGIMLVIPIATVITAMFSAKFLNLFRSRKQLD